MKYLGTCILTDEVFNKVILAKHKNGFLGLSHQNKYIYIPIKDSDNQECLYSKLEVNGIPESQLIDLIDSLNSLTNDIIKRNIPLNSKQIDNVRGIIKSNPPKSAICIETRPVESLTLGQYRSGDNYSIKLGDKIICDLNGKSNASRVFSTICSGFYNMIDNIIKQINTLK